MADSEPRFMDPPARSNSMRPAAEPVKREFSVTSAPSAVAKARTETLEPRVTTDRPEAPDTMAPDAPGAMQSQLEPEAPDDWRHRLQQMLAMGSPELFMQQSPALALLAGRLEFVEPGEIPAVVAQSPLLQSILSQAQTAEVLQTAQPLEQNLQMLGIAPSPLAANSAGPMMSPAQPLATLGETLEALGFDTQRILQEGDLLKNNLGLEGLQSYMERAERLRSMLSLPEWPTLPLAAANPSAVQKAPVPTQAVDPALIAQLSRLAPQTPALDTVQLWAQNPERNGLMPLTVLDDGSTPMFLNPLEASPEGSDPLAELNPEAPLSPTMDEVPLVMHVMPRAPAVAQDPFLAMAQRWNADTLQTLRPEDFMNRERMDGEAVSAPQPMRTLHELLSSQLIQAPDYGNRMDAMALSAQDNATFDLNTLQTAFQDPGSTTGEQNGDLSGGNSDSSFMNQDSNALFATSQGPASSNKAFSIETAAAPQTPSASVSPQQLQDILDKSSMLLKEGGGSIRLDLGSKDMGPLDLALDIKDKTVELRIVTHSDQAREALVQELPKLRESLQNQNLNLEKVEIGLNYSSAWSQSSGQGQPNREQFFENTSESSSRGPNGIRSTSRSYRQSFVSTPEARVPLHNGLIQVRV